jgi:hypothetical protein
MTTTEPQAPMSPKEAKAQAKAATAYAKAQQNWFMRHKIISAFLGLCVIGVIASAAGGGGGDTAPVAGDTTTTATSNPSDASQPQPSDEPQAPDNSTNGKGPLVWGNWESVGPIDVKDDGLNDYALTFRAKNTGDSPDEGLFTVTVLKGQSILGTLTCSTSTVQPGALGTSDCFSTDSYTKGWTEVTIENAF